MMKIHPMLHAGLVTAIALSASALGQARESADPCSELVDAVREARSIETIETLFQDRRQEIIAMAHCQPRLEAETDLPRLQRLHEERILSDSQRRLADNLSRLQVPPERLPINARLETSRQQAARRLGELSGLLATPPTRSTLVSEGALDPHTLEDPTAGENWPETPPESPPGELPQIASVTPSPLVPGTDVIIEGQGFGAETGTVALKTQGQTFTMQIANWQDGIVVAYLADSISGVGESSAALVELQRADGQQTPVQTVSFLPVFEMDILRDRAFAAGKMLAPGNSHRTLFSGLTLGNQWRIAGHSFVDFSPHANCALSGSPAPQIGGTQLPASVHVWSSVNIPCVQCSAGCQLWIQVEGPRGLGHGVVSPMN